jgi:hypothetical protein
VVQVDTGRREGKRFALPESSFASSTNTAAIAINRILSVRSPDSVAFSAHSGSGNYLEEQLLSTSGTITYTLHWAP